MGGTTSQTKLHTMDVFCACLLNPRVFFLRLDEHHKYSRHSSQPRSGGLQRQDASMALRVPRWSEIGGCEFEIGSKRSGFSMDTSSSRSQNWARAPMKKAEARLGFSTWPGVKSQIVPPVNIRFNPTTKIGSKMSGEFTYQPNWDPKTVLTTTATCCAASPEPKIEPQDQLLSALLQQLSYKADWSGRRRDPKHWGGVRKVTL